MVNNANTLIGICGNQQQYKHISVKSFMSNNIYVCVTRFTRLLSDTCWGQLRATHCERQSIVEANAVRISVLQVNKTGCGMWRS
jgi:hypothetical protein